MGGAPKYAAVNVVIIKCELCSKVFVRLFSTAFFFSLRIVWLCVCVCICCVCLLLFIRRVLKLLFMANKAKKGARCWLGICEVMVQLKHTSIQIAAFRKFSFN